MAKGPAVLAVMTKAPLFTATVWYEDAPELPSGKRVVIQMIPVPTPAEGTHPGQGPGDGAGVRRPPRRRHHRHTEDWHMLQRIFVADLGDDRAGRPRRR